MRYGIDKASVFLFDCLHLGIDFGFLVYPKAAKSFKETNFVAFAEALDAFDGCSNLTSVTFGDPNDWQGSHNGEVVGISGYDLSDPSTAASYLTSTYCRYYWKKG